MASCWALYKYKYIYIYIFPQGLNAAQRKAPLSLLGPVYVDTGHKSQGPQRRNEGGACRLVVPPGDGVVLQPWFRL